jgi:hypothetical protein
MKALTALRRFILAKCNSEEQHEVRLYVQENICDLARDFCVTTGTIVTALDNVQDDAALAVRLLETIRKAEALQRDTRKTARATAAQASADALASMVKWHGEEAHVDMVSLLSSALTKRNDLLVFTTDSFTIAVYMSPLFDLAKLRRKNLTAFVDANGLHVRWPKGGLNLRSQVDRHADRIVMSLPARVRSAAAA